MRHEDSLPLYGEVYRTEDDQVAEVAAFAGPWVFWGVTSVLTVGLLALM